MNTCDEMLNIEEMFQFFVVICDVMNTHTGNIIEICGYHLGFSLAGIVFVAR